VVSSSVIQILPYSLIVGQQSLKLALELAYIAPRLGGVLISGQRGTGKSTAVRAFAQMMYGELPITLPINATEDRVLGGWKINELMKAEAVWQEGLLEQAHDRLLYVDEVNLLDDHIVNIILDVTSTGVLVVQREGQDAPSKEVSFTLVGTMNPEEGGLRPQLLDRFGLMVQVTAETNSVERALILETVLGFDQALFHLKNEQTSTFIENALHKNAQRKAILQQARNQFYDVKVLKKTTQNCVDLASEFDVQGNRGDYTIALAARAFASLQAVEIGVKGVVQTTSQHVAAVARLALQHRRLEVSQSSNQVLWNSEDDERVIKTLNCD
jgi:magnesium chelatase subunit I